MGSKYVPLVNRDSENITETSTDQINASLARTDASIINIGRMINDTETIGIQTMTNLDDQHRQLDRIKDKTGRVDNVLNKANSVVTKMMCNAKKSKVAIGLIILIMLAIIVMLIIIKIKG